MVSVVPKTRPAYPPEFRREAIELLRAGRSPRELSESLGVSQQTLRNWRRQDRLDRHERDDGLTSDERDELRRLRRENQRLTQERDLLKRAAAFFANETRSGEHLPVHLGGEGPHPGLPGLPLARREPLALLRVGPPARPASVRSPTPR